ncbi:hypothetical protein HPB47_011357 [Ixodes persulcatus]|uniref:Uncharacterized protein n=1 Tax=Ixodes persulcatus TaxID=34615 RepID=A0AC60NWH8_IXOPE|nr:hypothetical protein HPB47_011357 [Ixodes persulcatus]
MAADRTSRCILGKYPKYVPTSTVVGDTQVKYIHEHFDPHRKDAPALFTQSGASILDVRDLLDLGPPTVTTLVLHVGGNHLTTTGAVRAFNMYCDIFHHLLREGPEITTLYATLVLPRYLNRCRRERTLDNVFRLNQELRQFNERLRQLCLRTAGLFYIDHAFHQLPPFRVLAPDGRHPSFRGVALLAGNLHGALQRGRHRANPGWLEPLTPPRSTCHVETHTDEPDQPITTVSTNNNQKQWPPLPQSEPRRVPTGERLAHGGAPAGPAASAPLVGSRPLGRPSSPPFGAHTGPVSPPWEPGSFTRPDSSAPPRSRSPYNLRTFSNAAGARPKRMF